MLRLASALLLPAAAAWAALASAQEVLHPRQAFTFAASLQEGQVRVEFSIEPGYYMYRDRFQFLDAAGSQLPVAGFPPGLVIEDEFFGRVETYRDSVVLAVPVDTGGRDLQLLMVSQGCADIGLCYPPERVTLAFDAAGGAGRIVGDYSVPDFAAAGAGKSLAPPSARTGLGDSGRAFAVLSEQPLVVALATFFLFGLLLSFTPCVLPMVPIVLAIVTGGRNRPGTARAFWLCIVYVLSMALVYAALGVAAARSGQLLSQYLQHPAVLALLIAVFVALGASMIGLFSLQLLPPSLAARLGRLRAAQGTMLGAAVFGATSAVVVSPCVAAPLVGALLFISQSGDAVVGGSALASLGLGMGMLPLAAAAGAGALLPRAGPLADAVRILFGLMMFAVAIWLAAAFVGPAVRMGGYAIVGFAAALVLARAAGISASARNRFGAAEIGAIIVALAVGGTGGVMMIGAGTGATSEFAPLSGVSRGEPVELDFVPAADAGELDALLATSGDRTTMVEFTAEWCASCRELEAHVFPDPQVSRPLGRMQLVRVDVTDGDPAGRALMERFGVFGPPALVFIDAAGIEQGRVLGYQDAVRLAASLAMVEERAAVRL